MLTPSALVKTAHKTFLFINKKKNKLELICLRRKTKRVLRKLRTEG